jgi:dimethylsulfone monooxygenase
MIEHRASGPTNEPLNIVCGWVKEELELFGQPLREHDDAYDYAADWIEVMQALWTREGEFDYADKYFRLKGPFHEPKPLQQPFPALMNAGRSSKGQHFSARYCDLAFIQKQASGVDVLRDRIAALRQLARDKYGPYLQLWSYAYVVQAATEREAKAYLQYYAGESGDRAGALNLLRARNPALDANDPAVKERLFEQMAGWNGYPLVGIKEQVAEQLQALSQAGLDGCLLGWVDFEAGMRQLQTDTLPLLEQMGLR